jgi:hypothetical protein
MTVTTQVLTRSYGGAFYENGVKVAGCQAWTLTRGVDTSTIGVLDQKQEVTVEDNVTYTLAVTEVIIDSRWTKRILDADVAGEQLRWLFIGETRRNDGSVERIRMDGATISGDFMLAGITRGSARTRDLEFQLDEIPQLTSEITS